MHLYLVRHGETLSNRSKLYAGWSNDELTSTGRAQAEQAAKKFANKSIDAIYTSPLRRTVQTAEIIAHFLNMKPIPDKSFIEQRLGLWEGLTEDEIARDFKKEWEVWNKRPQELVLDGRETLDQLLQRVLNGITRIKNDSHYKSILIVTHVAIIRVLHLYLNNIDMNKYRTIPVSNGQIFYFLFST